MANVNLALRLLGTGFSLMPHGLFSVLGRISQPVGDRGQRLDPVANLFCRLEASLGGSSSPSTGNLPRMRNRMDTMAPVVDGKGPRLPREEKLTIPSPEGGIQARLFAPTQSVDSNLPTLLFFHGGGWILGSIGSHASLCRRLAFYSGCAVISVDYRLAPENPFPAAMDDSITAYKWLLKAGKNLGLDPTRVAVGGDSAGGNISAVLCQQLRDLDLPLPQLQLLFYPATDLRADSPSHFAFEDGYFLTRKQLLSCRSCLAPDPSLYTQSQLSPLLHDTLKGLPEAFIVTAGFDPLRDEGETYAEKLREAGVSTAHRHYETMIHGFVSMCGLFPQGLEAIKEGAAALESKLRPSQPR